MVLRPSSRSQTSKELADVHGGAFHNNSTMSDSNMPNIKAQSGSYLGNDLAPIAHPGYRDIERTFLAHHQHLIQPIWNHPRKRSWQLAFRLSTKRPGVEMMMSSEPRQRSFRQVSRWRLFAGRGHARGVMVQQAADGP